jgi:hypothetical protein
MVIVVAGVLPLLNLFSGAALALVTLRKGAWEGLITLLLSAAIAGVLLGVLAGSVLPAVGLLGLFWLPLWGLAATLRYTVSLAQTLLLGALMAALAMLIFAVNVGDTTEWGRMLLERLFKPMLMQMGLAEQEPQILEQLLDYLAPLVLGLLFANGLASLLCSLLLGRWWQAVLFNPGGFGREFHELRLGRQTTWVTVALFVLAAIVKAPWLNNVILLLVVLYTVQGLAVSHGVVAKAGLARIWLIGLYVLMFLALPQMLMLLCLLGVIDAWGDVRARFAPPRPGKI